MGALVLRNFSEFVQIVSFANTPQTITVIAMGVTCILFCKSGIEAISRWSSFMLPLIVTFFLSNVFFSIPKMNIANLTPVLFYGIKPIISSAFSVLAFPLAEAVLFIGIFHSLKEKEKIYKVFFIGLLLTGIFGIVNNLKNILTLGGNLIQLLYFPSYTSAELINIGNLIERIEVTVAIVFILAGLIKISICIIVASKGIASFFDLGESKSLIVPVTLVMMSLAPYLYYILI